MTDAPYTLHHGDALDVLRSMPDASADMVLCSPPYEAARTYGIGFSLRGQAWVDWSVERFVECCRVSRGLVAWVVEGQTRTFRWSATPSLLMADLHRRGVSLRKPPIFSRVGIPGSGGPDWFRNDYEFIVCASRGKLPWSDNKACGHPPRYGPGGAMSNRTASGRRVNSRALMRVTRGIGPTGEQLPNRSAKPPKIANPGNIIRCVVGGGKMGHPLAHENEAPYPLSLAEFFVRSCCPPGGVVLDPFCGSGTTGHASLLHGRRFVGIDIRESQLDLTTARLDDVTRSLLAQPVTRTFPCTPAPNTNPPRRPRNAAREPSHGRWCRSTKRRPITPCSRRTSTRCPRTTCAAAGSRASPTRSTTRRGSAGAWVRSAAP